MNEVTIEITQYCPYGDCDYCSSNASLNGKHLPLKLILETLEKFETPINILNISGGEPMFHPNIGEILWQGRIKAKKVKLYTNMIDVILYNTDKVKDIEVEANVCVVGGRDRYLPKPTINVKTHLLKLVHRGRAKDLPEQDIVVSRNFWDISHCDDCDHILLQADGKVVKAPCKKEYSP